MIRVFRAGTKGQAGALRAATEEQLGQAKAARTLGPREDVRMAQAGETPAWAALTQAERVRGGSGRAVA